MPADTPRADHELVCICHLGAVCSHGCRKGYHHVGCPYDRSAHPRPEPAEREVTDYVDPPLTREQWDRLAEREPENPADDPAVSLQSVGAPEPAAGDPLGDWVLDEMAEKLLASIEEQEYRPAQLRLIRAAFERLVRECAAVAELYCDLSLPPGAARDNILARYGLKEQQHG